MTTCWQLSSTLPVRGSSTLVARPPKWLVVSMRIGVHPASAIRMAADSPASPPPTITTRFTTHPCLAATTERKLHRSPVVRCLLDQSERDHDETSMRTWGCRCGLRNRSTASVSATLFVLALRRVESTIGVELATQRSSLSKETPCDEIHPCQPKRLLRRRQHGH